LAADFMWEDDAMRLLGGMTNQRNDGQLIGADKRPQFRRLRPDVLNKIVD
jgi:hypothetical protein